MKNKRFILLSSLLIPLTWLVVSLQNYSSYFDFSINNSYLPSSKLTTLINEHQAPINITLFCSNELLDDLGIIGIKHWLLKLSPLIKIEQYNPIKSPEKSDHYDVTSDGVFVIESKSKRIDIDLIELILKNTDFTIEVLQNYLLQTILNIINYPSKSVLFVHSSPESILSDERPLGLSDLDQLLNNNHISVEEVTVSDLESVSKTFDTVIFYKIGPNALPFINILKKTFLNSTGTIVFSHPKYAMITNRFVTDIQFHSEIIEDSVFHLLDSKNQLITDYKSSFNEDYVALLPFSSLLSFENTNNIFALSNSSEESAISFDSLEIKGPFTVIANTKNKRHFYINNHLLPTNYWMSQAGNKYIVEDIFFSTLNRFPILKNTDPPSFLILTKTTIIWLFASLILLPMLIVYSGFFLWYYFQKKDR